MTKFLKVMNILFIFQVAYTFDAGPNACLFLLEEDVPRVLSLIRHFFRPVNSCFESFIHGLPIEVPRVTTVCSFYLFLFFFLFLLKNSLFLN